MTTPFENKIKELKKGCGKPFSNDRFIILRICGKYSRLCETCQAKLQTTKELAEQVEKVIDNLDVGLLKGEFVLADNTLNLIKEKLKQILSNQSLGGSGSTPELSINKKVVGVTDILVAQPEENIKGCGKKLDALGFVKCGEYDDIKHGCKQWLCEDCKKKALSGEVK